MDDNKELLDILGKEEYLDALYDIVNNKNAVVNKIINEEFIPKLKVLAKEKGLIMGENYTKNWMETSYANASFYNPNWKYFTIAFEFERKGLGCLIFGYSLKENIKREDVKDWGKIQNAYITKDVNNTRWIFRDFGGNQDWDTAQGIKDLLNGKTLSDFSKMFNEALESVKGLDV